MSSLNPAQDALAWESGASPPNISRPRSWHSYLAITVMIVPALGLLAIGLIAGRPPAADDIERGVVIGDVKMDGANWDETRPELEAAFNSYLETPIVVSVGDRTLDITPAELGISYDIDATHQKALGVGRGDLFTATRERIVAHSRGYDVKPVVRVDEDQFLSAITPVAQDVMRSPTNAVFYVNGDEIAVKESEPGVGVDPAQALRELMASATAVESRPIELQMTQVEPDIVTGELQGILDEATLLKDSSLRVSDDNQAWSYGPSEIVSFVTYEDGELAVDTDALAASLMPLADSIKQLAKSAEIDREPDGSFSIKDETLERTLDVEASSEAIAQAILEGRSEVNLVVTEREPLVTKARLLPLYRDLTEMVTRGVTLSWNEGAIALDKKAFSDSIYWNVDTGDVWFDHEALADAIRPVAEAATRPPTNLRWINGQVVTSVDSKPGLLGDVYASIPNVINAAMAGHKFAELAVTEDGAVDAEALGIQINQVLGSSSTYYGDSIPNRKTNVEVAAGALNGTLIPPHSTFSFNKAIGGTATLDDGYQMGYGIVVEGGEVLTVPSVAGGICQVATTTFQAAFWAGMPIETRSWHLYWIPKYGKGSGGLTGLDATVDPDVGLDFEFANPTDQWLAISAWADGQNVTIEVWGVSLGWSVEVDDPIIYDVVKASTETVFQEDDTLNPGQQLRVEHAQDGFSASIHRVVKDADGNVLLDTTFDSYYQPARNLVLVGPES